MKHKSQYRPYITNKTIKCIRPATGLWGGEYARLCRRRELSGWERDDDDADYESGYCRELNEHMHDNIHGHVVRNGRLI